jgi:alpha-glucuronidase
MLREHRISVDPIEGGWTVRCEGEIQPLMFLSGRKAEEQARALAAALGRAGHEAFVYIHDRSDALVGTARYGIPQPRILERA